MPFRYRQLLCEGRDFLPRSVGNSPSMIRHAAMIVMLNEGRDLGFEAFLEEVVFQQDAVLQCLVPTLDLALCLRMAGSAMYLVDSVFLQPVVKVRGDVTRAVVRQQVGPVFDLDAVAA